MEEPINVPLDSVYRLANAGQVMLISTVSAEKNPNVCTVAWVSTAKKTPPTFILCIGKSHKTHENLLKTGYLCINVPTVDCIDICMYCGHNSGQNINKIEQGNISTHHGKFFPDLPLVDKCGAWIECKVECIGATMKKGILNKDSVWDTTQYPTLHHLGGKYFTSGNTIIAHH